MLLPKLDDKEDSSGLSGSTFHTDRAAVKNILAVVVIDLTCTKKGKREQTWKNVKACLGSYAKYLCPKGLFPPSIM